MLRDAGRSQEAKVAIDQALDVYAEVVPAEELDEHPWVILARKMRISLVG